MTRRSDECRRRFIAFRLSPWPQFVVCRLMAANSEEKKVHTNVPPPLAMQQGRDENVLIAADITLSSVDNDGLIRPTGQRCASW